MVQREKKRNLLFINQYYYPDRASTGQLLTELCESLSDDFAITALVGTPSYSISKGPSASPPKQNEKLSNNGFLGGVRVIRVFNTKFSRKNMLGRMLNYFSFMFFAFLRAIFIKKPDIIITMSDPPTVNFIGYLLKKLKRVKLIQICQDVYPEIAMVLKQGDNPILIKLFSSLNRRSQNASDHLIVISDGMKNKLIQKGLAGTKISVIENWIDTDLVTPEPRENPFSKSFGLTGKFIVMHSGNIGLSQNLTLLLDAAENLKDYNDIIFVIIGDGAQKKNLINSAKAKDLNNVMFIPYQEKSDLKYSLSSGDLHFLSLYMGLTGLIVPSKIYGIMAAGRTVISSLETDDDVCKLIKEYNFGINVYPPDSKEMAKEILYFYNNRGLIEELGKRGREAVLTRNSKTLITKRYRDFLSNISIG